MERRDFLRLSTCLLAGGIPLDILEASQNYRILKGDTLSAIAKKFGTTVAKLKQLNGLKSTDSRWTIAQGSGTVRSTSGFYGQEIAKPPSDVKWKHVIVHHSARLSVRFHQHI